MKVDVRGYFFVLVEVVADFHLFNSTGNTKLLQLSVAWRDNEALRGMRNRRGGVLQPQLRFRAAHEARSKARNVTDGIIYTLYETTPQA
jgi:hypothetical protein